jgi:hypothetical protein
MPISGYLRVEITHGEFGCLQLGDTRAFLRADTAFCQDAAQRKSHRSDCVYVPVKLTAVLAGQEREAGRLQSSGYAGAQVTRSPWRVTVAE